MGGAPDGVEELTQAAEKSREEFIETLRAYQQTILTWVQSFQRRCIEALGRPWGRWDRPL